MASGTCATRRVSGSLMAQTTLNVTLLQTTVRPALRGRVISRYVLVDTSALSLGSLAVGAVSQRVGVRATVLAEGGLALLIGLLYLRNRRQTQAAALVAPALLPTAQVTQAVQA